ETVFDRRRQIRRGGLLDELLMAALDRALALVKVDGRPLAVAEHLDLDVARAIEVALDVDVAPAERGLGTPGRRRERRRQVLGLVHPRHADAATAGHCLEDHGIPDLASDALGLTGVRHRLVAARHTTMPAAAMSRRASVLSPIWRMASGDGPTKIRPARRHASAKRQFSERKP